MFATALFSATIAASTMFVSADEIEGTPAKAESVLPVLPAQLKGARPATSVAGNTRQEKFQPETRALLSDKANRNIRWQPWEYRSAFSASVLEQLQKKIKAGTIKLGEVSIEESDTLYDAVEKGAEKRIPELVQALQSGKLDLSKGKDFKLAVYTYRHNYADNGLFQLYVSGTVTFETKYVRPPVPGQDYPFMDIQALQYEFEDPDFSDGRDEERKKESQKITLWRGAVVRVDAEGTVENVAGSIAGVKVGVFDKDGKGGTEVKNDPFSDWELASVLKRDAYDPAKAKDDRPPYVHPADRLEKVEKLTDETEPEKLGVKPSTPVTGDTYKYNGPRSTYRFSRFLLGNGR
jgi:hypothetical protein